MESDDRFAVGDQMPQKVTKMAHPCFMANMKYFVSPILPFIEILGRNHKAMETVADIFPISLASLSSLLSKNLP
jgi:hypothetical protein